MFGSVFLGDPRQRLIASTSPPTSPIPGAPKISPEVALQLRIRWLEALLLGVNDEKRQEKTKKSVVEQTKDVDDEDDQEPVQDTLLRRAEEVQRKLDLVLSENDGLKRFIENCVS